MQSHDPSLRLPRRRDPLLNPRTILPHALSVVMLGMAGCGQTGSPLPPSLQLPETVGDLTAQRIANKVELKWTMPRRTTDKLLLKGFQPVHICRHLADGPCISVAEVSFVPEKPVTYEDLLPADLASGTPQLLAYSVEVLSRPGRTAGASNLAFTVAGLAPPALNGVHGEIQAAGVVLQWQPAPLPGQSNAVKIDRALLSTTVPGAKTAAEKKSALGGSDQALVKVQNLIVHFSPGADPGQLLDPDAAFEQSYSYRLERIATASVGGKTIQVEGPSSAEIVVATRDVFPPGAPSGLAAVAAPREGAIDLSWTPNPEKDLAGYAVYRSESSGNRTRISDPSKVVDSPAFRDQTAAPGREYLYSVTALDIHGNESKPSAEATETLPPKP